MLLNDIHLPILIKSLLSEHKQFNSVSWNNLDQLSLLWAVFTKCKSNIKDGFRLENLSWRLWYRQSIMQKNSTAAATTLSENIEFDQKKRLRRSQSLPNIYQFKELQNTNEITTTTTTTTNDNIPNKKKAFYIDDDDDDDEEEEEELMFNKNPNLIHSTTNFLSKPVSLLSDMIQQRTTDVMKYSNSSLRRCQARYCKLDQFFLNAA